MSDARNQTFSLRITTLTPVHIGTGARLAADLDFYAADDATWVLDADVALDLALQRWEGRRPTPDDLRRQLEAEEERLQRRIERNKQAIKEFDERPPKDPAKREQQEQRLRQEVAEIKERRAELARRRAELEAPGETGGVMALPDVLLKNSGFDDLIKAELLTLDDLRAGVAVAGRPLTRYRLAGRPAANEIYEQIKDVADRLYLPGASLKGAIRSALLWEAVAGKAALLRNIGDGKKTAGNTLEQTVFLGEPGRKMNPTVRDVLRALRVGDSAPLAVAPALLEVAILNSASQKETRLAVEALPPGVELRATLQLERYPFVNQEARRALDFGDWSARLAPEALAGACRGRAAALIAGEREYFARHAEAAEIARFYAELAERLAGLGPRSFLLPLGWGAGWRSKTLDDRLRGDGEADRPFADLVQRFKLKTHKSAAFRPGDRFPQTRKAALAGGRPWRPLGWIAVDIQ